MPEACDVVVVPDFRPDAAADFELRTLLFLASWTENAGAAREWPVHLACIGDPPESVRRLASRCGASITVHPPLCIEPGMPNTNKLRGLEVRGKKRSVLLLDVDVLVLGDPSAIGDLGPCIAAAPALGPRFPWEVWEKIYGGLGMEPPRERIAGARGRLDCPARSRRAYPGFARSLSSMAPYYGGGVLLLPRSCDMRSLWEDHTRRISTLFSRDDPWRLPAVWSDQTGFSTAVRTLRNDGVPFRELPDPLHATWLHVFRRRVPLGEIRLFHAFRLGAGRPRGTTPAKRVRDYRSLLAAGMAVEAWRQDVARLRLGRPLRDLPGALADSNAIGAAIERLFERHVAPILRETA